MINKRVFALLGFGILTLIAKPLMAWEEKKFEPFKEEDYLHNPDFEINKKTLHHGQVVVSIIQVHNKHEDFKDPKRNFLCHAWLEIKKNGIIVKQIYHRDIDAVAAGYGFFVSRQPLPSKYLFVGKSGDYRSILYLIGKDGTINEIHGGCYFVTRDSKFLFSRNSEAEDGVTDVFDLVRGKQICSENIPVFGAYYKGGLCFFTESRWPSDGKEEENKKRIFIFDFEKMKFFTRDVDEAFVNNSSKIECIFDLPPTGQYNSCGCKSKKARRP